MTLRKALEGKKFAVTCELFPPKGADMTEFRKKAASLRGLVDAINITDNQFSQMRMTPLVACHFLKEEGIDPNFQIACRDRNVLALQSDLLGASALGIENVFVIGGDRVTKEDEGKVTPVFNVDAMGLLRLIKTLQTGVDHAGKELKGTPTFFLGAATTPGAPDLDVELSKFKAKVDAGDIGFSQTQIVYDADVFKKFRDKIGDTKVKFIIGVMPPKTLKSFQFMATIPGIVVPAKMMKRMEAAKDVLEEGIQIVSECLENLRSYIDGVHIMTMNDPDLTLKLIQTANLKNFQKIPA